MRLRRDAKKEEQQEHTELSVLRKASREMAKEIAGGDYTLERQERALKVEKKERNQKHPQLHEIKDRIKRDVVLTGRIPETMKKLAKEPGFLTQWLGKNLAAKYWKNRKERERKKRKEREMEDSDDEDEEDEESEEDESEEEMEEIVKGVNVPTQEMLDRRARGEVEKLEDQSDEDEKAKHRQKANRMYVAGFKEDMAKQAAVERKNPEKEPYQERWRKKYRPYTNIHKEKFPLSAGPKPGDWWGHMDRPSYYANGVLGNYK